MENFKKALEDFKQNPGRRNENIINYFLFFSHVSLSFIDHLLIIYINLLTHC